MATLDHSGSPSLTTAGAIDLPQPPEVKAQRHFDAELRLAFDGAPTGVALVGLDGRWLKVNHAVCEMTGYSEEDLLATTFQTITHPDDLDADLELVQRVIEGEIRSYEMEKRYFRADGSTIWVMLAVSLVRAPDGSPAYFVSHIEDITDRKEAEAAAAALRADLERSNHDLEQFASAISHDLCQPLAIVSGYARLLETSGRLDEGERGRVAAIVRAADRMNAMIDGLLALARLGGSPSPDPCDLTGPVGDAIESLEAAIQESGAKVEIGELPAIAGDRTQLSRVFQNLISNSIKFCASDAPRIRIDAARAGGSWVVRVSDNGIGIPEESADAIFDVFKRLEPDATPGDGLGLAIAKRIVEQHDGKIWAESNGGGGLTIGMELPAPEMASGPRSVSFMAGTS